MYLHKRLLHRLAVSLEMCKEEGFQAGIAELGRTLRRILFQKSEYVVVANELSDQLPLTDPEPGLVVRQLTTLDEIGQLNQIVNPVDMARFYEMFDRGSIVFAAFQSGYVVGCCWISDEADWSVNRVQPPLRSGDACVHDLFVSPSYRSQGIGRVLVSHRLRYLCEHGYKRAIGAVRKGNVPAFKINKKTGYIHIGEMSHRRILFWDWFSYNVPDG